MTLRTKALCTLLGGVVVVFTAQAHAVVAPPTTIQVMPPLQLTATGGEDRCKTGEGHKLLSWNAESSVHCNANVTVNSNSLLIGTASMNGNLYIGAADTVNEGAQLYLEGAGNYDTWYPDVNQNNLRFYTNSSNANQVQIFNHGGGEASLYVEGGLGVGTAGPAGKLHVTGGRSYFVANSEPYAVGSAFSASGGVVYFGAASSSATPDAVISNSGGAAIARFANNGNVGIGSAAPASKLDVAGGVKVSNDASACTAAKAGTIRWTGTAFQGCDGKAWVSLGGRPKVDYTTCVDAIHDLGTGLVSYYNQWGATGAHNINLACPYDYVMVAMDHNTISDAYCCKLKIE